MAGEEERFMAAMAAMAAMREREMRVVRVSEVSATVCETVVFVRTLLLQFRIIYNIYIYNNLS